MQTLTEDILHNRILKNMSLLINVLFANEDPHEITKELGLIGTYENAFSAFKDT